MEINGLFQHLEAAQKFKFRSPLENPNHIAHSRVCLFSTSLHSPPDILTAVLDYVAGTRTTKSLVAREARWQIDFLHVMEHRLIQRTAHFRVVRCGRPKL